MLTVFYSIFSHWYQKNTKIRCAALISGQEISDRNGFNSTVSLKIEQQLSISTYQFHVQPPMHDFVTFFVRSSQIHVRTLRHSKYNCSLASFLIFSSASAEREIVPIVANALFTFSPRIYEWEYQCEKTLTLSLYQPERRRKVSITVERLRATDRGSIAEAASINFCTQRELDFNEPFKRRQKVGLFPQHIIQSFMHFIFSVGRVIKVSWSGLGSILGS